MSLHGFAIFCSAIVLIIKVIKMKNLDASIIFPMEISSIIKNRTKFMI
jgi:hypothetical protein